MHTWRYNVSDKNAARLNMTEVTTQFTFQSSKPIKGAACFYCIYINYSEIKASERLGCLNIFEKQKLLFIVTFSCLLRALMHFAFNCHLPWLADSYQLLNALCLDQRPCIFRAVSNDFMDGIQHRNHCILFQVLCRSLLPAGQISYQLTHGITT